MRSMSSLLGRPRAYVAGAALLGSRFASGVLVALASLGRSCACAPRPADHRVERSDDAKRLETALVDLSRVFYYAEGRSPFVPLREELGFAELYLGLQALRFDARLGYRVSATDDDALEWPVRRLSLFPILERAISDGLELSTGPAFVAVEILRCRRGSRMVRVTRGVSGSGPLERVGAFRLSSARLGRASTRPCGSTRL